MEHPLCDRVVTWYRNTPQGVQRQVIEGCFYSYTDVFLPEGYLERRFFLVIPGRPALRPGDRVLEGEGPLTVDWHSFVPAAVEGLSQVDWVKQYEGHIQAGSGKTRWD